MMTRTRMILLSTFVVALGFLLAGNAYAGEYTIHNCPASLQPNFDAGPIQPYGGPLPSGSFQSTCTPGSTLGPAIGWYGSVQGLNSNVGATIKTPSSSSSIREIRVIWSVAHQSSGSDTFAQITSDVGVNMFASTPYEVNAGNPTRMSFPSGTYEVNIYSYCSYDDSTNCYFPTSTTPIIKLEGIDTTLESSTLPAATVDGGSLAGTVVSSEATLQFNATDEESGVREAQLLVDGRPLVTNSYASQCSYTTFAACPQSEADSMTWDTATVANGEHQIALRVTDASGNTQTVDSHTVLVSNATATTGTTTTSEGPPPPPCVAAPGTQSAITVEAKHATITTAYRKRAGLRGTLTGPGRKPISNATVEVLARPLTTGAVYAPLGHVTTSANGQFKLTLPPGISRRVCLRYQQQLGGRYAAALNVTQQVQAGVTLAAHPKDIESNGTIILTGSVLGGYISSAGKVVELQVLYLGRWRVFETTLTKPDGQFTAFYSFLGGLGTFAFRARVRGENDYPYALGYSKPVRVTAG